MATLINDLLMALPGGVSRPQELRKSLGNTGARSILDPRTRTPHEEVKVTFRGKPVEQTLEKSMTRFLDNDNNGIERLAFQRNPKWVDNYAGIYRPKLRGIPPQLLLRIAVQDELVATIVAVRCQHLTSFGQKQQSRHTKGFKFEIDERLQEKMDAKQKEALQTRIDRVENLLLTCGHTKGYNSQGLCSFAEYLYISCRNAIVVGQLATEVVWAKDPQNPGRECFHSFRPVDSATIFFAANQKSALDRLREQAKATLERLNNEERSTIDPNRLGEYSWVQVVDGTPMQAFTSKELLVENFYPTSDMDWGGYPIAPLESAISAVTTHISLTRHNQMYFQNGRASRGMLVLKGQDVDGEVTAAIKQEFNASINSSNAAFRMPVFGIGPQDEISWQAIDQGSRDMEFQYLCDANARSLLSAFQMSPEELPGLQHLSRGTNTQALSEADNEWKLTAARDVGIRPLIGKFEQHLNQSLIPLIDPEIGKFATLRLIGLDIENEEKESVRLQQDAGLHMTYDEILSKVEKKVLGADKCGEIPLNPAVWALIKENMTFGEILEKFRGIKGASQKPEFQFYQNPVWLQWQDFQLKKQEMEMQQQQMQAQAQQQAAQQGQPQQGQPQGQPGQEGGGDLSAGVDQLGQLLGKGEDYFGKSRKKLRAHQKAVNDKIMESFKAESSKLIDELVSVGNLHCPLPKT